MTTNNHTPIALGAAGDSAIVNAPLAELDAAMGDASATGAASLAVAIGDASATGAASLSAAIGVLTNLGTTVQSSLVGAIGSAALRTTETSRLIPAINSVYDDAATAQAAANLVTAEVTAARGGHPTLDDRIDAISLAGSGVYTLANGAANAGQKVIVVDSTTGFLAGGLISYTLVGGAVETNTIDTVDSPTQLTCTVNLGTGGIANNTFISMIPVGIIMSSGAVVGGQQQAQEFEDGVKVSSTSGTTAKWIIKPTYATFSGTRDEIMFFGWNVNGISGGRLDASEASLYHGIEADYFEVGTGKHFSEWYIEFYDATGAITRRPYSTSVNRADGTITNQFKGEQIFYKSDGTLAWQIDTSGNLSSANIIRFTQNDGSVLTQLNAVGNAYINLIRLNSADRVVVGDTGSTILMTAVSTARVGIGGDTPDTKLHIEQVDAGTNGVVGLLTLSRNSSGTAAAGFGSRILFELSDAGALDTSAAMIDASWNTATNGATKADLAFYAHDTGAREGFRIRGNGGAAAIGFYGVTPIERAVLATGAGATVDNVITALQNLGLVKQS